MVRNTLNVPRSLFVGFEPLLDELERIHSAGKSAENNYPPHNVVKIDEEKFLIEMALAGFKQEDISVSQLSDSSRFILHLEGYDRAPQCGHSPSFSNAA